jgi:RNA polymerase sigma factor (sigma-70 family)
MKISHDSELVKDSIQEFFYRMWKNNIDLHSISNVKFYLLKGLRRQILNVYELKNYQVNKIELDENIGVEFSPEDYFINDQTEEQLRTRVVKALNKLSPKQREAIYLRYFEGLDYAEIAGIMNINIQSAKNNVQRALESLKDLFTVLLLYYSINKVLVN